MAASGVIIPSDYGLDMEMIWTKWWEADNFERARRWNGLVVEDKYERLRIGGDSCPYCHPEKNVGPDEGSLKSEREPAGKQRHVDHDTSSPPQKSVLTRLRNKLTQRSASKQ